MNDVKRYEIGIHTHAMRTRLPNGELEYAANNASFVLATDYDTLRICYDGLLDTGNKILAERDELRKALEKAERGLLAAQNHEETIEFWANRGEVFSDCKRRLIAEGVAALKVKP